MTVNSNAGPDKCARHTPKNQGDAGRVIKNSIANVITGASIALTAVVVPPVLARTLSPLDFGAWVLILQIAGYVKVLDLGMQGAVGRYVAYYLARCDALSARQFASTAICLLFLAATLGATAILVAAENLRLLFPQMPLPLFNSAKLAMALVGVTVSIGLPASVFRGILVGIERNELVTRIAAPSALMMCGGLIIVAVARANVIDLALVYSIITLATYGLYWVTADKYGHLKLGASLFRRALATETISYCSTTVIWSAAMLFVSGLDVALVGRLDFRRVAVYAACVAPITILAGAQNAMFGPMLQVGARYLAQGAMFRLKALLERATRISVLLNLAYVVPLFLFSHAILKLWLGPQYAKQGTLILRLLLIGQAIRLIATPYANLLLAIGQHHRTRVAPIVEGTANFTSALLLGMKFGAVGVAGAAIIGSVAAQLANYFYNFPRTPELIGVRSQLLWNAVGVPLMCLLPLMLLWLPTMLPGLRESSVPLHVIAIIATSALMWRFGLAPIDKELLSRAKSKLTN